LGAKFQELVQKGNKLVLEQIVTTITSVVDTAEEKFIEYYDKFMPHLKYMIGNATTAELRLPLPAHGHGSRHEDRQHEARGGPPRGAHRGG